MENLKDRIMKMAFLISAMLLIACNNNEQKADPVVTDTIVNLPDSNRPDSKIEAPASPATKTYVNERFRNVTVENLGNNKFRIRGEGQIFEASFGWVLEDGHDELDKGFQMTDAGAPAWGKFDFTIDASKKREATTRTLILFESSAKDGSRLYELPIVLN